MGTVGTNIANAGLPWRRRPEVWFSLRFAALAVLAAAVWAALTPLWPTLTAATAEAVAFAARPTGLSAVTRGGAEIYFLKGADKAFDFTIIPACTAVMPLMIFAAAIVAYPATSRQRVLGLAIGLPTLFVANLTRLVGLAWVGVLAPSHFEATERYWGQAIFLAVVGAAWLAWVWFVTGGKELTRVAGRLGATDTFRRQGATLHGRRRAAAPVAASIAALAALGVLGLTANGVAVWGHLLDAPVSRIALFFELDVNGQRTGSSAVHAYGYFYGTMAAVVALFFASPGVSWHSRTVAALFVAVPGVYIVQETMLLALLGVMITFQPVGDTVITAFVLAFDLPLSFAIPAVIWHWWLRGSARNIASKSVHPRTRSRRRTRRRRPRPRVQRMKRRRRKSR